MAQVPVRYGLEQIGGQAPAAERRRLDRANVALPGWILGTWDLWVAGLPLRRRAVARLALRSVEWNELHRVFGAGHNAVAGDHLGRSPRRRVRARQSVRDSPHDQPSAVG